MVSSTVGTEVVGFIVTGAIVGVFVVGANEGFVANNLPTDSKLATKMICKMFFILIII